MVLGARKRLVSTKRPPRCCRYLTNGKGTVTKNDAQKGTRMRALESALFKVRWFGVAFAVMQIFMGADPPCHPPQIVSNCEPSFLRPVGYALAISLGLINLLGIFLLTRVKSDRALKVLGLTMFSVDHLFLISFTWLYSFGEFTTLWIVLYILPLEGALRYRMVGAMTSVGISIMAEVARDFWRLAVFGYEFTLVPGTSFRLGILTIVALVAGIMARNLEREREEVERRATAFEELASKESLARREIQAFYHTTLAGVSGENMRESMQSMVETIGETLKYDSLAIALLEETAEGEVLRVEGGYRYPKDVIGKSIDLETGICGPVARTGEPALVEDVSTHPSYLEWAPWARSEMAVPLKIGDRVIGVLNVESPNVRAFDSSDLDQLSRLAAGVAVVVQNARVLRREHQAVERLTELDAMKSDFISITSHELRTPLTSIQGFIKTLRRPGFEPTPEQLSEYLEVIDRQSERLSDAIEDLLFLSQIERGTLRLHQEDFDLASVIRNLVDGRFSESSFRIVVDVPHQQLQIRGDKDRCQRILAAVIDNALKFSPPNSNVDVTLTVTPDSAEVSVTDRGIGIAEEHRERIFDRFFQVGGAMDRPQQGFGLGLYIVKRVTESLGGEVRVSSEPGKGATFKVILPTMPRRSSETQIKATGADS